LLVSQDHHWQIFFQHQLNLSARKNSSGVSKKQYFEHHGWMIGWAARFSSLAY